MQRSRWHISCCWIQILSFEGNRQRRPYDYLQHRESELSVSDKDDLFIAVECDFYLIGTFLSVCADSSDTDQYGGHRYSKFYSGIRTDRDCDPERLPKACASSRTAWSFDHGAEYAADQGISIVLGFDSGMTATYNLIVAGMVSLMVLMRVCNPMNKIRSILCNAMIVIFVACVILLPDLFSINSVFSWRMIFIAPLVIFTYYSMKYLSSIVHFLLRKHI